MEILLTILIAVILLINVIGFFSSLNEDYICGFFKFCEFIIEIELITGAAIGFIALSHLIALYIISLF